MSGAAVLEPLPWDSELYGLGVARLEAIFAPSSADDQYRAATALLAQLKQACRRQRIDHVVCRAGAGDYGFAQALEQAGFRYTDTSVTLTRGNDTSSRAAVSEPIGPATDDDIPALQRIAAGAFANGRVDHDPRLPKRINRELYRRWIANACRGRSDVVLVFRFEGTAVGFICCNLAVIPKPLSAQGSGLRATAQNPQPRTQSQEPTVGFIDLLAVASEHQGKGIGRALLRAGLAWLHPRTRLVEIRTQLSNSVSLLLYQQEGFQMVSPGIALPSGHSFHGWFEYSKAAVGSGFGVRGSGRLPRTRSSESSRLRKNSSQAQGSRLKAGGKSTTLDGETVFPSSLQPRASSQHGVFPQPARVFRKPAQNPQPRTQSQGGVGK